MYLVGAWADMETAAEAAAEEEDRSETGSGTKDFNIETKNKEIVTKDRDISTTYIYVWKLFATRGELDLDKGLKFPLLRKTPTQPLQDRPTRTHQRQCPTRIHQGVI